MITIRPEMPNNYEVIEQITIAAFTGKSHSDGTEYLVIRRLREANALSLSLIAETENKVVGHVAFSIVTINGKDIGWYGLGPISVAPEFQKQGIGSALIKAGLSKLKERGAQGCVLEGDPNYYQRFGFRSYPNLIDEKALDAIYFMALPFYNNVPSGIVEFHQAFYTPTHS